MTTAGENLTGTPWTVYPRPQMKRDSYISLNGGWDFTVDCEKLGQIRVPFCTDKNERLHSFFCIYYQIII